MLNLTRGFLETPSSMWGYEIERSLEIFDFVPPVSASSMRDALRVADFLRHVRRQWWSLGRAEADAMQCPSCRTACHPQPILKPRSTFRSIRHHTTGTMAGPSRLPHAPTYEDSRRSIELGQQRMYAQRAQRNRTILLYGAGTVCLSRLPLLCEAHSGRSCLPLDSRTLLYHYIEPSALRRVSRGRRSRTLLDSHLIDFTPLLNPKCGNASLWAGRPGSYVK